MTPWPVSVYLLATHRSTTLTWINIWRLTTIALHCYCCYLSIQTVIDPLELKPVPVGTDKAQTIRFIIVIGLRCEIKKLKCTHCGISSNYSNMIQYLEAMTFALLLSSDPLDFILSTLLWLHKYNIRFSRFWNKISQMYTLWNSRGLISGG